ncbi:MAG: hypothetical protein KGY76_03770 [Candidatus Thermoplasmatota archaeon]|nr:hypothetical protein [Candidatus Thermoplasmatota archaeon]
MKVLRDKKSLTRFLILYKSAVDEPNKLADIASDLDMSEQAASNYISEMEQDDLIDRSGRKYHPTSEGMEFVREILGELGSFLDEATAEINFISTCTAVASENITEGDEVGLFMEDGLLHASLRESTSKGTALQNAKVGEPVKVGGLHGITEMDIGRLYLLEWDITDDTDELENVKEKIEELSYDKIAVMEEAQYGLCNMIDLEPDIIFAPIEASINAAEKGLDILFMLSKDELDRVLEKLNRRNRDLDEEYTIDYEVI